LIGWSEACVVEDQALDSLLVYPGGCSLDAIAIVHQAIRGLLDESFSGMCLKDVMLSAGEELFSRLRIINYLQTDIGATVSIPTNETILLRFMSCLFAELDHGLTSTLHSPAGMLLSISSLSHSLSETQLQTLLSLHTRLLLYEGSNDVGDRLVLSRFLVKAIPTLRQYGLGLNPCPAVLWLVGRCVSISTLHAFGVSPSMTPGAPWEVVWDCTVVFPPQLEVESGMSIDLSPMRELLLRCLRILFPDQQLPDHWCGGAQGEMVEWIGLLNIGSERQRLEMASQESAHFAMAGDSVYGGEMIYYSKEILLRQRGQISADDLRSLVRDVMLIR
jgi:hypothetical protein